MKTENILIILALVVVILLLFSNFSVATAPIVFQRPGFLSPYTAVVIFSLGLFLSNFVWNTIVMAKPFVGDPVPFSDYFTKGNTKLHLIGILGGMIWSLGMAFSIIASGAAGFAIAYGLGQGATMVAALWGVFIWREFKDAPVGTNKLLAVMFIFFITGLGLIILSRFA